MATTILKSRSKSRQVFAKKIKKNRNYSTLLKGIDEQLVYKKKIRRIKNVFD